MAKDQGQAARPQGTSASQHLRKNRLLRPQSVDCLTCKCIEASRYQVVAKAFLHYGGEGGLKPQASGKPRFTSEFAATAFTTAHFQIARMKCCEVARSLSKNGEKQ